MVSRGAESKREPLPPASDSTEGSPRRALPPNQTLRPPGVEHGATAGPSAAGRTPVRGLVSSPQLTHRVV
jgi:hypothetical protein